MWLQHTTPRERRTLTAGYLGYGLDGFDFMIYTFVIPTLLTEWHLSKAQAGLVATAALLTSAVGGWAAGVLADRFGRVRILQLTVLWFSVCTFASGWTQSFGQLLVTRGLQGLGFGGEWAVGAVLVAETIAARHRGKATGLVQSSWAAGWAAAAAAFYAAYALAPPQLAWRILFWLGLAPALVVVYIRGRVQESPVYLGSRDATRAGTGAGTGIGAGTGTGTGTGTGASAGWTAFLAILRPPLLGTTVLASLLCCGMLSAYYSVTTWLPTYLKNERQLTVIGTTQYLLVLITGSLAGYLTGAWLADALGRRRCFILFAVCGGGLVLAYTWMPISNREMLVLGFPLGFFLSGIFSGTGAFLAELFPSSVRGSGQGFCYSIGRAVSAVCPALIGALSNHGSLGFAIGAIAAAGYGLVVLTAWVLPETYGRSLET